MFEHFGVLCFLSKIHAASFGLLLLILREDRTWSKNQKFTTDCCLGVRPGQQFKNSKLFVALGGDMVNKFKFQSVSCLSGEIWSTIQNFKVCFCFLEEIQTLLGPPVPPRALMRSPGLAWALLGPPEFVPQSKILFLSFETLTRSYPQSHFLF